MGDAMECKKGARVYYKDGQQEVDEGRDDVQGGR